MTSTLTDQREKIKDGKTPMPLYTCVHVKKDVPAKSFQEWVEFSPYEIGLPKYGTFMDSSLFGSKFFMGKLVKHYQEQPLHFLQGIWGSAFCILFKRLLDDNRKIDPAEMIRQEMGKNLEELQEQSSSDCSDCGSDDDTSDDENSFESNVCNDGKQETPKSNHSQEKEELMDAQSTSTGIISDKIKSQLEPEYDSAYDGDNNDDDENSEDAPIPFSGLRRSSVQLAYDNKKGSLSCSNGSVATKGIQRKSSNIQSPDSLKKTVNWGCCPKQDKSADDRRKQYSRGKSSMRKSKSASMSYWKRFMKVISESDNSFLSLINTRQGRAAVIHNFMRGLSLQKTYPLSPFTPLEDRVHKGDEFDGIFEMHPTSVKNIYMVDAGLTFNSPYPLVLRPQREVDIILSFDFSARQSDNYQPFKELLLAEKWAKLNRLPFPPIDLSEYERDGMKELYIFKHPTDPLCPVVLHFVLINKTFRKFSKPGVPRKTKDELDFADFDIFDDPEAPYSTFNFTYTHHSFQRLTQLTEFNTRLHVEDIKEVIKESVQKKKSNPTSRYNFSDKSPFLLNMKSVIEMKKRMNQFIKRLGSVRQNSVASPNYVTPQPGSTTDNTFFANFKHDPSTDGSVFDSPRDEFYDAPDFVNSSKDSEQNQNNSSDSSLSSSELNSSVEVVHQPTKMESESLVDDSFSTSLCKNSDKIDGHFLLVNGQGTFEDNSENKTTNEFIIRKKKESKQPPNIFFANHNFNTFSFPPSSTSSSSTESTDSTNINHSGKNSKPNRIKPHPSTKTHFSNSPLVPTEIVLTKDKIAPGRVNHDSQNQNTSSSPVTLLNNAMPLHISPSSDNPNNKPSPKRFVSTLSREESFHLAPVAFQMDGTPVFDYETAKMFHEDVKNKRKKMFRRQSTVSSLNSMSLEEIDEYYYDTSDKSNFENKPKNLGALRNNLILSSIDSGYVSGKLISSPNGSESASLSHGSEASSGSKTDRIHFTDLSQFGPGEEEDMEEVPGEKSPPSKTRQIQI